MHDKPAQRRDVLLDFPEAARGFLQRAFGAVSLHERSATGTSSLLPGDRQVVLTWQPLLLLS